MSFTCTFIPFAFETFGASGTSFDFFLKTLANRYQRLISWNSSTDIADKSSLLRFWRARISTCLQKQNARLIISKVNRIKRQTRQGSTPNRPDLASNWTLS